MEDSKNTKNRKVEEENSEKVEKSIKIKESLWKTLQHEKLEMGHDSISDVIEENFTISKTFSSEKELSEWFQENYEELGFSKIIKKNIHVSPDYIMEKEGKQVRVELETLSSHFIKHKHKKEEVDLCICIIQDKPLPVKTLVLKNCRFSFQLPDAKLIQLNIPDKLNQQLKIFKVEHNLKNLSEAVIICCEAYIKILEKGKKDSK